MVNCYKCGKNLIRNAKFCSNCGDAITWPEGKEQIPNSVGDFLRDKGTEIIHDNLPEEYIDKIKDNIPNYQEIRNEPESGEIDENQHLSNAKESIINASETIKQSSDDFISSNEYLNNAKNSVVYASDAVKKSSSTFINNNISYESQDKIKSGANNFSKSTKNFLGNASEVFSNIQAHRSKVKQQKREERKVENEIKKVKMDEDKELREKERAEKEKQNQILKEETHQNNIIKIRATRTVSIEIPYHVPTDDVMHGSIKGEMMGSAAGRAMEGLFGDNNSLSSTVNAGLILGGVGSLIGGIAAASDDGIRWNTAQLYIADDEIIISGKYSLSFDEIKLISVGKYKSSDIIVFTLQNQGLEFKTDDALALKIVIEEYIQKYNSNKKSPGNVDDLLKYGELYEKGIITKEELEMKKKELL